MEVERNRRARIRLPPWLAGNDLIGFARDAQLKLHPVDASTYIWDLETLERYEHRQARLFELVTVAGPDRSPDWSIVENLSSEGVSSNVDPARLASERERLIGSGSPNFAQLIAWVKVATVAAADGQELVGAVSGAYEALRGLQVEGGSELCPDLAVHVVINNKAVARRAQLARVLMRIEDEPELLETRPVPPEGQTAFGSAWHLHADLNLGLDAYLIPLLLCQTPFVWAFAQGRVPGVVVFDLATAIVGRPGEAAELLQHFLPPGTAQSTLRPVIGRAETTAALSWWVERLNSLFRELTDLANYADASGEFRPRRQFEVLLSIEQLGRRIQSILANDRDLAARRVLAFSALDTLHGIGVVTFDEACRLPRAEKALEALERGLPAPVAAMLLPTARRAVESLRSCQSGFFLSSRVGAGSVRVPDKRGGEQTIPAADAVGQYMRVLRNANHGFSGQNDSERRRDEVLLMAHDGDVPGDFALLPYLYWLELLAKPENLGPRLRPRRR